MNDEPKLPKGFTKTAGYRCYARTMGAVKLLVTYSASDNTTSARLVVGFDTIIARVFNQHTGTDAELLEFALTEAKRIIRSWAK